MKMVSSEKLVSMVKCFAAAHCLPIMDTFGKESRVHISFMGEMVILTFNPENGDDIQLVSTDGCITWQNMMEVEWIAKAFNAAGCGKHSECECQNGTKTHERNAVCESDELA